MRDLIRRTLHSRFGAYIRFLWSLTVLSVVLFAGLYSLGCDNGGGNTCGGPPNLTFSGGYDAVPAPGYTIRPAIDQVSAIASPGQFVARTLRCDGMATGTTAAYTYSPPPNSYGYQFSRAPSDFGSQGYVWRSVPRGTSITFNVCLPQKPAGHVGSYKVTEYLQVSTSDGQYKQVMHTTALDGAGSRPEQASVVATSREERPTSAGTVVNLGRWIDFLGQTMDATTAEAWFRLFANKSAFFALRVPVAPPSAPGESVGVPFVTGPGFASQFRFQRYVPSGYVYTATVALRPDWLTYAANALPQAAGQAWLTLGVAEDSPPWPDGLSLSSNNWTTFANLFLDLSSQPNGCTDCILPLYFCFEGNESPLARPSLASATAPGVTCFGPQAVAVSFDGPWQIFGAGAKTVAVGQSMSFHHRLSNRSGGPLSFNVVLQSDPSLVWRLYGGSSSAPNLGQPLTGPIQVANQATKDVWAVCNPLTADARRGPGALIVTAAPTTQPTASRWASDLFYVGEWVAPAPPSDAHRVYLPIAR